MPSIIFGLSNGRDIVADAVRMVSRNRLSYLTELRAEAAKCFGNNSPGIGFIGSPAWAIGGALAVGLLQGIASAGKEKEGIALLKKAESAFIALQKSASFIPVSKIDGLDHPDPLGWIGNIIKKVEKQITDMGASDLAILCDEQGLDHDKIYKKKIIGVTHLVKSIVVSEKRSYVCDGGQFLAIHTDGHIEHIRCNDISTYRTDF